MENLTPRAEKVERNRSALETALGEQLAGWLNRGEVGELDVNEDGRVWVSYVPPASGNPDTEISLSAERVELLAVAIAAQIPHVEISPAEDCVMGKVTLGENIFCRVTIHGSSATTSGRYRIALRKHRMYAPDLQSYVDSKEMLPEALAALELGLDEDWNIGIVGAMFGGKTTFLNATLKRYEQKKPDRRYGYIEDVPEILCPFRNFASFTVNRHKSYSDRIREAMRCNLESIGITELRGAEGAVAVSAWSSAHNGSHTTWHASSVRGALRRLETFVRAGGEPVERESIAAAIDAILVLDYKRAFGRRVVEFGKVDGVTADGEYKIVPLCPAYPLVRAA